MTKLTFADSKGKTLSVSGKTLELVVFMFWKEKCQYFHSGLINYYSQVQHVSVGEKNFEFYTHTCCLEGS